MSKRTHAIALIILSALCFALMNTFVRLSGDLPSVQKSFFRNLVAMFIALGALLRSGGGLCPLDDSSSSFPVTVFPGTSVRVRNVFRIQRGCLHLHLLRSGLGTLGILCNFYAIDHLLLANASMLNKMSPFFVLVFSFFVLKERMRPVQVLIVVTAFVGSLFIIQPVPGNMALFPSLMGFVGGMCAGFAYTMVRAMGLRGERGPFIVFFFSAFSCAVTLPWLLFRFTPMTVHQLLMLLGAGLAAAGGQFTITAAYTLAPGREISVYDYTQIIFSTLIGFLLFGQVPNVYNWVGYVLIVGAAIVMFLYNNGRLDRRERT